MPSAQATPVKLARPSVTKVSITVSALTGGERLTVTGKNFTKTAKVKIGRSAGKSVRYVSSTRLTVIAPANSQGMWDVTVSTKGGTSKFTQADKIHYIGPPAVNGVEPSSGSTAGGTAITIGGTDFLKVKSVTFDGIPATSIRITSSTDMRVVAPANAAGAADIKIVSAYGTGETTHRFTYTAPPPPPSKVPTVTGVFPLIGRTSVGSQVAVLGTNFVPGSSTVMFGNVQATMASVGTNSSVQLWVVVPRQSAGTVDIRVTTPNGTSAISAADQFTYAAPPTLSGEVTRQGGSALQDVEVDLYSPSSDDVYESTDTDAGGTYSFTSIAAGSYIVCFFGEDATDNASDTDADLGYADACSPNQPWNGEDTSVPANATPITVASTTTVNTALAPANSVLGEVTSAANDATLDNVTVSLFKDGVFFDQTKTIQDTADGLDGVYLFSGLSPGSYTLCFDTTAMYTYPPFPLTVGPGAPSGYESQCYDGVAWDPTTTSAAAAQAAGGKIALTSDDLADPVTHLAPQPAGTISGVVTDPGSNRLKGVNVEVYRLASDGTRYQLTNPAAHVTTAADGSYDVTVAPGTYYVCFDGTVGVVTGGASSGGYFGACDNDLAWQTADQHTAAVADASPITLSAGQSATASASLAEAAAITGTLTDSLNKSIQGDVYLFQNGTIASVSFTVSAGQFTLRGLAPGNYTLCFYSFQKPASAPAGYQGQCYNDVPWSYDPNSNAAVSPDPSAGSITLTAGQSASFSVALQPNP